MKQTFRSDLDMIIRSVSNMPLALHLIFLGVITLFLLFLSQICEGLKIDGAANVFAALFFFIFVAAVWAVIVCVRRIAKDNKMPAP